MAGIRRQLNFRISMACAMLRARAVLASVRSDSLIGRHGELELRCADHGAGSTVRQSGQAAPASGDV
jgi:hypothetical protein